MAELKEIDLKKDALYIVKDGMCTEVSAKGFGQDLIIWKNGQVLDVDRSERFRIQGQEVI